MIKKEGVSYFKLVFEYL